MADKEVDIRFNTKADVKGARKMERALDDVEQTAKDLRREVDKIDGIDPKVKKQIDGVANSMDRAAATGRQMAAGKQAVGKSSKNSSLAILEFSRAVEDAQYGIRGVLNNLPSLIQFMGGGAGLAGAVSLAAVGLTQLFSLLTQTEEATKDFGEQASVSADQVKFFVGELAEADGETFRRSIEAIIESLGRQNAALQRNLALVNEKRKAELEIAKLSDDLELAQIAGREAAGQISGEEAREERLALELRKIRREEEARQAEIAQRISDAEQQRLNLAEEEAELRERLLRRQEQLEAAREKAFADEQKVASLNDNIARGQELVDDNKGFGIDFLRANKDKIAGRSLINRATTALPAAELAAARSSERLAALEDTVSALEEAINESESAQMKLSEAQGQAFNLGRIQSEAAEQAASLQIEIARTKDAAKVTVEATKDLSSGISDLEAAASSIGDQSQADRRLIEISLSQMQKVSADGELTIQELKESNQILGRLAQTSAGASKTTVDLILSLQVSVSQLASGLARAKLENARIKQQITQLGGKL